MNELNEQLAQALFGQFAGQDAVLTYYYKYRFHFTVETAEVRITLSSGGSADEIYRFELTGPAVKVPATMSQALEEGYDVWVTDKGKDAEGLFRATSCY